MYSQDTFLKSILDFLSKSSSGALMISGAWGAGKTFYINNTLIGRLKENQMFPIVISLFGQSNLDGLEKRITEVFLQEYKEEALNPVKEEDKNLLKHIKKITSWKKAAEVVQGAQSIAELFPVIGQFVDIGGVADIYIRICSQRLPKDKTILIFDDLERAAQTIPAHQLLGIINDLVETKKFKVILIANDSYFNKTANAYLDFKEKVIDRTLFFPSDIMSIYKKFIGEKGESFEKWMMNPRYINVINPGADIHKDSLDIQEDLTNLRILKFSVSHFFKVFDSLSDTIKANPNNQDLDDFILSLWALTVGLSIEYKRNRLTYLDKDAFIKASAVQSFMVDPEFEIKASSINPQHLGGDEKTDKDMERIRGLFSKYIERHELPLVPSILIFDLITAGIGFEKASLLQYWEEHCTKLDKQRQNPAEKLLQEIMASVSSFTNDEFLVKLRELADYMEQAAFIDINSYINAATILQHYRSVLKKGQEEIESLIVKGIDKYFEGIDRLPERSRISIDVIVSEIPKISRWVVDLIKEKMWEEEVKEQNDSIQEAIRQFKEDLPVLAERLAPTSSKVPDFYSFPILSKIPEEIIIEKFRIIEPRDVNCIVRIINSRFVQKQSSVSDQESAFILSVKYAIDSRDKTQTTLSDIMIDDYLLPRLNKLISQMPI